MGKIAGIQGPDHIQTKQLRIAYLARERPELAFTSLAHHIDVFWMHEAYRRIKKKGASGVDGKSASDFEQNLMGNLKELVEMLKSGNYKAPPVRRIYLEKGDGKKRPIGIPTFADKVLQKAVAMIMEPIYEQDFHGFSYGYRPKRSAHQAIDAMTEDLWKSRGAWLVEIDVSGFFDNIDHKELRAFLDRRVRDGVLRRAIDKWLKAGVMEDGVLYPNKAGTPQGGVISPLLANIFMHELVDKWFVAEIKTRMPEAALYRYADDMLMTFRSEREARRVLEVTGKRFAKYGLELHPVKTRIIDFRRPFGEPQKIPKERRPGTFDFLGFTFYWAVGRKGFWCLKAKTRKEKLRKGLKEVSEWCQKHRHMKVQWQHKKLCEKLQGHYVYFGRTGNTPALENFFYGVCRIWQKWLSRRSQKRHLSKTAFYKRLCKNPLRAPKIVHSR